MSRSHPLSSSVERSTAIVIELKQGDLKPEYVGKMNFYCSVVNVQLHHTTDQATIDLILCRTKDRILVEYALRGIQQPIGVSDYELTCALPDDLQFSLPSISELEAKLSHDLSGQSEDADEFRARNHTPKSRRRIHIR